MVGEDQSPLWNFCYGGSRTWENAPAGDVSLSIQIKDVGVRQRLEELAKYVKDNMLARAVAEGKVSKRKGLTFNSFLSYGEDGECYLKLKVKADESRYATMLYKQDGDERLKITDGTIPPRTEVACIFRMDRFWTMQSSYGATMKMVMGVWRESTMEDGMELDGDSMMKDMGI